MADKRSAQGIPWARDRSGRVEGNIVNYDGVVRIGSGDDLFDTKWDAVGRGQARIYDHGENIAGISVIRSPEGGWHSQTEETLAGLNYTRRFVPVSANEVAVFLNQQGRYLLARVRAVDVLSQDEANLEFDYHIPDFGAKPGSEPSPGPGLAFLTTEEGERLTTEDGDYLVVEENINSSTDGGGFGTGGFGLGPYGRALRGDGPAQLEFDLYAPFTPNETRRAAREAASRLAALAADTELAGFGKSDIGSNNPPPEFFTGAEQKREVYEALNTIADLEATDRGNWQALGHAGGVIATFAKSVLRYIADKSDKVVDGFAENVGANLSDPAKLAVAWTLMSSELLQLWVMVKDAVGAFLGF